MSVSLKDLGMQLSEVEFRVQQKQKELDEVEMQKSEVIKALAVAIAPQKKITLTLGGKRAELTICVSKKTGKYFFRGQSEKESVDLDAE